MNLCQKIKLFTQVLAKPALDGYNYAFGYTEWYFIRDAIFCYDNSIKRMIIDVSKDTDSNSGYSRWYAVGKDNHHIFADELVALFDILGMSFEKNINFHEKIIFSEESSKKLLEMGLDIDVNNIKKVVKARNNHLFFQQVNKSGDLRKYLPKEIIEAIFNFAELPVQAPPQSCLKL